MKEPTRRRYLQGSGTLLLAGFAGCLDDSSPPETDDPVTPAGDSPASTPTQSTTTAAGSGESSTSTDDPGTDTPTDEPETTAQTPAGPVAWQTEFDDSVRIDPVVNENWVYAGSDGGTVRRHRLNDGEVGWSASLDEPVQELRIASGTLYAISGSNELSSGHTLRALDAATGAERWTFQPTSWWLELVAARNGTVYVSTADDVIGSGGETLYALSADDGTVTWDVEVAHPREGALTDETLVFSGHDRLYAFDRADGSTHWETDVAADVFTTLAVVDGTVVYATEPDDDEVYSVLVGVDLATGDEQWRFNDWNGVSSTVIRDGTVYAGGSGVAALDPADGSTLWTSDEPGFIDDAGVTAERVYGGGDTVQAYDRDDGETVWEWTPDPTQGGVFAAGALDGRLLFDAYHDGDPRNQYKFAVDAADGGQQWSFEDGTELTDLAVASSVAVTGGENGRLYGLD